MTREQKFLLIAACVLLLVGVQLGALGAHALNDVLTPQKLNSWQLAVQYQLVHGLGVVLIVILAGHFPDSAAIRWSGRIMLLGILLFSGSIYISALGGPAFSSQIAPLGGTSFMLAWLLLGLGVWRN
jgi:uncharacterized membrane protein YgdD (TMEM256/DUF423 family)